MVYLGVRRPAEAGIMCATGGRLKKGDKVENSRLDEVLMGLVYRARTDPAFKYAVRNSNPDRLEQVLRREYRYDLTEDELERCKLFARMAADEGWSEEELDARLQDYADPIQDPPVVGPTGV